MGLHGVSEVELSSLCQSWNACSLIAPGGYCGRSFLQLDNHSWKIRSTGCSMDVFLKTVQRGNAAAGGACCCGCHSLNVFCLHVLAALNWCVGVRGQGLGGFVSCMILISSIF